MTVQKPSIPRGMRDFGAKEMLGRNYIFNTIRSVFQLYGYQPLETPAMENLSTLTGKYGEEGDKLLFKVLNSGNFVEKATENSLQDYKKLTALIAEKGLRYDLTVPFARYVVMNRNELTFPFKRYQIQAVWRADKPQKGRYREFYQCDVDVVGNTSQFNSLLYEVEMIKIIDDVFNKLGIEITIKINSREILNAIVNYLKQPDNFFEIINSIDKIEKIGLDNVILDLKSKNISDESIEKLKEILLIKGTNEEKLEEIRKILSKSITTIPVNTNIPFGIFSASELIKIFLMIKNIGIYSKYEFDLSLARGLSYYTRTIYEVKANNINIGSICGGGRYDNLTEIFGVEGLSGVGISFGADRIYDVMSELNLFPKEVQVSTKVLFVNFGDNEINFCLPLASKLRDNGISTEVYPDAAKIKKQFSYADAKKIPFVIIVGQEEIKNASIKIKDMNSGIETTLLSQDLLKFFI